MNLAIPFSPTSLPFAGGSLPPGAAFEMPATHPVHPGFPHRHSHSPHVRLHPYTFVTWGWWWTGCGWYVAEVARVEVMWPVPV